MAGPQNTLVTGQLTFNGSISGQVSIEAQPLAGGLTLQLPGGNPVYGQALTIASIKGFVVALGWTSVLNADSSINLSQLAQSGAATGQILTWSGSAWVPTSGSGGNQVQQIEVTSATTTINFDLGSIVQLYTNTNTNIIVTNADEGDVLYLSVTAGTSAFNITFDSGSFNGIGAVNIANGESVQYIFFFNGLFSQCPATFPINNNQLVSFTTPTGGAAQPVLAVKSTEDTNGDWTSQWIIQGDGTVTVAQGIGQFFNGSGQTGFGDHNWGIGLDGVTRLPNTGFFTTSHVGPNSVLKIVHGGGTTDGFAIGQPGQHSDIEIDLNNKVWVIGDCDVAGTLTAEHAFSVGGSFTDGTASVGTAHQVLTSSVSGTQWALGNTYVDMPAQNDNISSTPILTPTTSNRFRVSGMTVLTSPDGGSSTTPMITITYNDFDTNQGQSITLTATNNTNQLAVSQQGSWFINASSTTPISYTATGYTSGTPNAMQYALHIVVEALQ